MKWFNQVGCFTFPLSRWKGMRETANLVEPFHDATLFVIPSAARSAEPRDHPLVRRARLLLPAHLAGEN
jgi:hypothetical protein